MRKEWDLWVESVLGNLIEHDKIHIQLAFLKFKENSVF